jgi:hypothetical protein
VDVDPADRDGIARTLAAADEVLRQHVPDAGGTCWGCLNVWGRLAPYPCQQARWATAVRATLGNGEPPASPG